MPQETLSSRERVVRTLRRQPVDRLPIDLGSHTSTGISAFAYWRLREHLGLSTDSIWLPDAVQCLAMVDEDIRRRFHVDCVLLEPAWPATAVWNPHGPYRFRIPAAMRPEAAPGGGWTVIQGKRRMRMPAQGFFFDGDWLSDWGEGSEAERLAIYAREAERIYKETPYATNFLGYSRGLGFGAFFGGLEQTVRMLEEPEAVKAENEELLKRQTVRAGKVIEALGRYVQLLTIVDDMGMQNGPLCRPSVVEECVAPYLKRFCEFVHRHSDLKIFLHSCGSIRAFIPLLIDCGVDVLNPVQISAAHMEPAGLKRDFGDRIVFWGGGCDTQNVLGFKSPAEVGAHVREVVRTFKPSGGFVFNQVHNIVGNVPAENIVAMLDAAYAESFYS
jgi:uroporphyrinogen decarboxylase